MATCHHLVVRPFPKRMDNVALPLPVPFGKGGKWGVKGGQGSSTIPPYLLPCLERDGEMVGWKLGWVSPSLATRTPFVDKGCVVCFRQRYHFCVREGRTRRWGHVTLPLPFGPAWGLNGACLVPPWAFVGPLWGLPVPSWGPLWFVWACLGLVWCLLWTIWGIPGA